jgi:two-component system nitrogen regulation sensor histidine kinase GlnL
MKNKTENTHAINSRVIENLHTAVLLLDESLRVEYMNPACEMLFAVSTARFLGHPAQEVLIDRELNKALEQVMVNGVPITERELELNLGYRARVTVDLTAVPLTDDDGRGALLVEMSQVDRQLRITREEGLMAQSHATRALVRGLAHEIKNPLGGLRGAAQLLERELTNEELKEYTTIIISEADRLQALMNQMLGPSSLPRKREINVHEAVERVRQVVSAELSGHVKIRCDYDPSIPNVYADLDQLIQALMNLVRNAAQAIGSHGEITLRTRTLRQYTIGHTLHKLVARIDVIDNGPGIPHEMRESLFLPMVTGRADGTGLGLPIAQSLININDGLIEWESHPGHTVFTILLPIELGREQNREQSHDR